MTRRADSARAAPSEIVAAVDAVWRIDGSKVVATIARMTGDLALAEDLTAEAVAEALEQWPTTGAPRNAAAWLTAVAKRRAIDGFRRRERLDDRHEALARRLQDRPDDEWEPIADDIVRLVFTACHPVLSPEAQAALTLRVVAGLTSEQIARLFLVSMPTMQARITRAKRTLTEARVPFEVPDHTEWGERLAGVLRVVYLIFTEGYAATSGDRWIRRELADEALRLGRLVTALVPREPEALALLALMEIQASRFRARIGADGEPVLLADQDRMRWDRAAIDRGRTALARADAMGRTRGFFGLQAAIAECHAVAASVEETDWERIVVLYEALGRVAPSPVVDLNRAVAVSMARSAGEGLEIVDGLVTAGALAGSHLVPSVRGELLARTERRDEARTEFLAAAALARNERERAVLEAKAAALA